MSSIKEPREDPIFLPVVFLVTRFDREGRGGVQSSHVRSKEGAGGCVKPKSETQNEES